MPSVLTFKAERTPAPDDPPGAAEFYQALGVFIVAWGRLEGHFTGTLLNLMRIAGAHQLSHVLPISWKGRADLFRTAFKVIPALAPLQNAASALITEIVDLAQDRHMLIHASWQDFYPSTPTRIAIVSIKHKKSTPDGLDLKKADISLELLQKLASMANDHNQRLSAISRFVSKTHPPPKGARQL